MERLYESIADELEALILSKKIKEGERLSSERTLANQYGVSRNVVREAIKILSERKLITNIVGKGNYVTLPKESDLADMVESTLNNSNISINEIVDAREYLELAIAKHIFLTISELDLSLLYENYDNMELSLHNSADFLKFDTIFHAQLAQLSKNRPLQIFYMSLGNLISKAIYYGNRNTFEERVSIQKEHKLMLKALENRDLQMFKDYAHRHLKLIRDLMSQSTEST